MIHIYPTLIYKLKSESVVKRNSKAVIKFSGLNANFGDVDVNINDCEGIPDDVIELCKSKLGKCIPLPAGNREKQNDDMHSSNPPVPKMFQVRKQNVGKCQIYAAILLIHTVDIISAQYLH